MGNDTQRPAYPQILEIPPGLNPAQFMALISDRIKDLNVLIKGLECNPSVVDLAMANFRITGLADPTDDLDAVNLRTLRRQGVPAAATTTPTATTSTGGAYTIVSDTADTLVDGDLAPAYVVGSDRIGTPEETWIYAQHAPTSNCAVNWYVQLGGVGAFQKLLSSDIVLPAGSKGPIFSAALALRVQFPRETVVEMQATTGGGASGVSMGVVMKVSS